MLEMPKLVKLENGSFVYQYQNGIVSQEYLNATEYNELGNAKVTTLKGKDLIIDKYGNYVRSITDWYDCLPDKLEEFMFIETALFANKEEIQTIIRVVKNEINARYMKKINTVLYDSEQPQKDLKKFDEIIKAKYKKESENLIDYIDSILAWQKELSENKHEQNDDDLEDER